MQATRVLKKVNINFLYIIKMSKKTLKFDYDEVNKKTIHVSKQPIALHLVHTPCWFSLNNSERIKAVTLAFCII